MQNCQGKEQRAGETQSERERDSAEVSSVRGREGSGMTSIFSAAKDRGKQKVVSSFLLQL